MRKNNFCIIVKYFLIIITFIIIIPNALFNDYQAASKIDYQLESKGCDNNRLFNVDVYAYGSAVISAVDISIEFDSSYVEYRGVTKATDSFEIASKGSGNKIDAVLLSVNGYRFKDKTKLMSFKFKSVKSGKTGINLSVGDPVDNKRNSIKIGNVYGCRIIINGDSVTASTVRKNSTGKSGYPYKSSYVNGGTSVKSDKTDSEEFDPEDSAIEEKKSYDLINNVSDSVNPYLIGALILVAIVIIFCVAYKIGKQSGNEKDKSDKQK